MLFGPGRDRAHDREPDERGELFHDRTVDGVAGAVLYDPARHGVPGRTDGPRLEATDPGVREVLHARFTDHAYPLHTHDAWTLFIVDDGVVRYDLGRHDRLAEPSMVSVLPPHVAHDGRPARAGGYRKRVIYLEPDVLGEAADRAGRSIGRTSVRQVCAARSPACTTPSPAPTTRSTRRHGSHSSSSGSGRRSGCAQTPGTEPSRPDAAERSGPSSMPVCSTRSR